MKGKALRKHSLHEKTAASVLLKPFIIFKCKQHACTHHHLFPATPGVWRTVGGVVIPMEQGPGAYWAVTKPEFWAEQRCTEMDYNKGFRLDDTLCESVESVICEKD